MTFDLPLICVQVALDNISFIAILHLASLGCVNVLIFSKNFTLILSDLISSPEFDTNKCLHFSNAIINPIPSFSWLLHTLSFGRKDRPKQHSNFSSPLCTWLSVQATARSEASDVMIYFPAFLLSSA